MSRMVYQDMVLLQMERLLLQNNHLTGTLPDTWGKNNVGHLRSCIDSMLCM